MKKILDRISISLLSIFVIISISFGWNQILQGDEPVYCYDPASFLYGMDCAGPCDAVAIKQCLLQGDWYACCEYEPPHDPPWYCWCHDD